MNDKINKISVVMTSYNGEKYIREQLDSIITNITENDELIIGDDGSTDNTISIIDEYLDKFPHIKLVKSQKLGTTNNLERLISMTNGDIIFIADQDDVWDSQKVSKICNAFQDNPEIYLVFHNSKVSGADINDILHISLFDYLSVSNKFFDNLLYFHFWGCMFAFRKRAKEYLIPFRFGFDSWIMFCVSFFKNCYLEKDILMTYRRHGNNLSTFKRHNIMHVIAARIKRIVLFLFYLPITYYRYRKSRRTI